MKRLNKIVYVSLLLGMLYLMIGCQTDQERVASQTEHERKVYLKSILNSQWYAFHERNYEAVVALSVETEPGKMAVAYLAAEEPEARLIRHVGCGFMDDDGIQKYQDWDRMLFIAKLVISDSTIILVQPNDLVGEP
jgi:hypothetical protein